MTRAYLLVRHRRGGRTSDEPPAPCALSPAASYVDSCPASTSSPPHHTLHIIQVPYLLSRLMHARPCKAHRCSRAARRQWCDEQERGPIMGRISYAPTQHRPMLPATILPHTLQASMLIHVLEVCDEKQATATHIASSTCTSPTVYALLASLGPGAANRPLVRAWGLGVLRTRRSFPQTPCFYIHRTVKFITHRCLRHMPGSNDTFLVVDRIQNVSLMLTTPLAFRLAVMSGGIPNRRPKRTTLPSVR
jgi:hypothetical protein